MTSFAINCCYDAFRGCADDPGLIQAMMEDALHTDLPRALHVIEELDRQGELHRRRHLYVGIFRGLDNYQQESAGALPAHVYHIAWTILVKELDGASYKAAPDFRKTFRQLLMFLSGSGRFEDFIRMLELTAEPMPSDYLPLVVMSLIRFRASQRFPRRREISRAQGVFTRVKYQLLQRGMPDEQKRAIERTLEHIERFAVPGAPPETHAPPAPSTATAHPQTSPVTRARNAENEGSAESSSAQPGEISPELAPQTGMGILRGLWASVSGPVGRHAKIVLGICAGFLLLQTGAAALGQKPDYGSIAFAMFVCVFAVMILGRPEVSKGTNLRLPVLVVVWAMTLILIALLVFKAGDIIAETHLGRRLFNNPKNSNEQNARVEKQAAIDFRLPLSRWKARHVMMIPSACKVGSPKVSRVLCDSNHPPVPRTRSA